MKKINFQIVLFATFAIFFCFISVVLFTWPAFIHQLNLSDKSNIGSAIGGLTAPVIGILTAILLYKAFMKQVQSNNDQKVKNESDIIFLLINQLNTEVEQFYHSFSRGEKHYKYTGIEGLNKFIGSLQEHDFNSFNHTFKAYFEANHLLLLIRSYKIIEDRIKTAALSDDLKKVLELLKFFPNMKK
jgi:HD-GYP domain-containing protein (c-di-GMP phosphodiesterase class II)